MTTAAAAGASGFPGRRAVAVVVLGVGLAAGAAATTILSLIMRSVTAVGGSCADGGPDVPTQPCPSGTGTALLLVFACALTCVIGTLWAASVVEAPMPLLLAWPALFLTLGWNFLEDGLDPPMGEDVALGFVVCGVLFVLVGAGPVLMGAWTVCRDRRSRRRDATTPRPRGAGDAGAVSVAGRLERPAALREGSDR